MNESEELGLHSFNEPRDPLSAREAAGEAYREQFRLEERLKMSAAECNVGDNHSDDCPICSSLKRREKLSTDLFSTQSTDRESSQNEPSRESGLI